MHFVHIATRPSAAPEYVHHRPPAPRSSLGPTSRASWLSAIDQIGSFHHTLDECSAWHGTCPHVRDQRLRPWVLWRRTIAVDGRSALYETSPLRRRRRDLHAAAQPRHDVRAGKRLLGSSVVSAK